MSKFLALQILDEAVQVSKTQLLQFTENLFLDEMANIK
jgi:hypothetical protein